MTFTMDKNGATGFKDGKPIMQFLINDAGLYALEEKHRGINGLSLKASMLDLHKIYGHACKDKLLKLLKANPNLSVIGDKNFECTVCMSEKIHQEPYAKSKPRTAQKIGDVIHTDVGFMPTPTKEGFTCYISFIDEYTLYSWVYLMASKNIAVDALIHLRRRIKTQFETSIKRLVLDNGPEYLTKQFKELLDKKGIEYDPIPINTPQLNGRAERLNRTLKESTRCYLKQSNMESHFWGAAITYANMVNNALPKKLLNNKSPYAMLYNREPNYKKFQQFGAHCYYLDKTYKNALESKGKPAIFIGLRDNLFEVYDLEKEDTLIVREVKFYNPNIQINKTPTKEPQLDEQKENLKIQVDDNIKQQNFKIHEPNFYQPLIIHPDEYQPSTIITTTTTNNNINEIPIKPSERIKTKFSNPY